MYLINFSNFTLWERNYGFDLSGCREHFIPLTRLERENQLERDDLGLLADTIERLDAEIETDLQVFWSANWLQQPVYKKQAGFLFPSS